MNCIVTALQDCSEDILTNYNVSVFLLVLYVPIIFAVLLQKEFQLKFQVDAYDLAYQTYFYANEKSEPNSVWLVFKDGQANKWETSTSSHASQRQHHNKIHYVKDHF